MFLWVQKNLILAIVLGAMAAVIATESSVIVHQAGKLGEAKSGKKEAQADLDTTRSKLAKSQNDFKVLASAHNACVAEIKVSASAQAAAIAENDRIVAALDEMSKSTRKTRDTIYLEPSCNALANLDLNAMCPALVGSLRQRAAITRSRTSN